MEKTLGASHGPLPPKLEALKGYSDEQIISFVFSTKSLSLAEKDAEVARAFMDRLRVVGDTVAARLAKEIKAAEREMTRAKFKYRSLRRRFKRAKATKRQPDWVKDRFARLEKVRRKLKKRYIKLRDARNAMI